MFSRNRSRSVCVGVQTFDIILLMASPASQFFSVRIFRCHDCWIEIAVVSADLGSTCPSPFGTQVVREHQIIDYSRVHPSNYNLLLFPAASCMPDSPSIGIAGASNILGTAARENTHQNRFVNFCQFFLLLRFLFSNSSFFNLNIELSQCKQLSITEMLVNQLLLNIVISS